MRSVLQIPCALTLLGACNNLDTYGFSLQAGQDVVAFTDSGDTVVDPNKDSGPINANQGICDDVLDGVIPDGGVLGRSCATGRSGNCARGRLVCHDRQLTCQPLNADTGLPCDHPCSEMLTEEAGDLTWVSEEIRPEVCDRNGNCLATPIAACTTLPGWHNSANGELPFWTFITDCGLPSPNTPDSYPSDFARWTFEVPEFAVYAIRIWVPASPCEHQRRDMAPQMHYILERNADLNFSIDNWDLQDRDENGEWVTLLDCVWLAAGEHRLYLYDDARGGCSCNETSSCVRPQSGRIYADHIRVEAR